MVREALRIPTPLNALKEVLKPDGKTLALLEGPVECNMR